MDKQGKNRCDRVYKKDARKLNERFSLAYVDTNILVSYALGNQKDKMFHVAERFFEDVLNEKYLALVSHFVLCETLHTLRNIATEHVFKEIRDKKSQGDLIEIANSAEFRREVNDRSLKAFKTILDYVTNDPDHFKFGELKTTYSEEAFLKALGILSRILGEFRVFRYQCSKCDSKIDCEKCGFDSEIRYKSFNAPDLTHVLMSVSLGCKYLFTMDRYFSEVPKGEFPIEIIVLRGS